MAISTTSCCLSLPLPPSASKTANQLSWLKNEKWRRQYMIGIGCVIIGLQINDFSNEESIAMAIERSSSTQVVGQKWSERRICPSWNLNSLETIVPENLPRPSARRRWESVKNIPAPALNSEVEEVGFRRINGCFTM